MNWNKWRYGNLCLQDKDSDIVEDDRKPTDADDIIVNKTSSLKKQGDSQARNRSTKPSKTD